jgi:Uma2 family endonuclease
MGIPDVSFVPLERLPEGGPTASYMSVPPGLAVEVVSPGNSALELRRRTRDYLEAGVSIVWVVWPEERSISVYRGSMTPLELTAEDTLDGGDVLPGFSVKVANLFDLDW